MIRNSIALLTGTLLVTGCASMESQRYSAADDGQTLSQQRERLAANTEGKGFGPQSPRNIDMAAGDNAVSFNLAPPVEQMNLCNIHFHHNAEHQGGEFTRDAAGSDGHQHAGFLYSGELSAAELRPVDSAICSVDGKGLQPGDTIELHYVYSSAQIEPGPTLGACLSEAIHNPQLRVEAQVLVLVNDQRAADFAHLTEFGQRNGYQQALNLPTDTGTPVQYAGSTTGPAYNEQGSPFQVSWSVRPQVAKVDIESVGRWCDDNAFNEHHAHGVRNLVTNPALLSTIE